jgi:hypothetical protein
MIRDFDGALKTIQQQFTLVIQLRAGGGGGTAHESVQLVRCAFFTMDSAVLGVGPSGCSCCTVRVSRLKFTLEDAIEFHAFAPPLEALACV